MEYAERLFVAGNRQLEIHPRSFDRIVVVFDRDAHRTYHDALRRVTTLNTRHENDEGAKVPFEAVASVPCFELWFLLHFEDVHAPIHRTEAAERLRHHIAGYAKGQGGHWAATRSRLEAASQRAAALAKAGHTAMDGTAPYTAMHELVGRLVHLKDQAAR